MVRPVRAKVKSVMPQSLTKIYLHIVFHIKNDSPRIGVEDLERVHAYIGQLVNKTGCINLLGRWNRRPCAQSLPIVTR